VSVRKRRRRLVARTAGRAGCPRTVTARMVETRAVEARVVDVQDDAGCECSSCS